MNNDNINMPNCLLGKPIEIPTLGLIYPLTIDEILEIGMTRYNQYLSLLTITTDDILNMIEIETEERIEPFEFLLLNAIMHEDFKKEILDALSFLLKKDIGVSEDGYFYIGHINDCICINISNFGLMMDIICYQNCISKDNTEVKAKNAKQKEFMKRLKEVKSKYNIDKNDIDLEISNIISSVCAKHPSINLLNVHKLTMYQLIDQFKRLNMIDEYFINADALIHGASQDDVQIKHWASTLLNT